MGSETESDSEKPLYKLHLQEFLISNVPVANAQYALFVEDAGHSPPDQ
jgi:formylglycine-generating enzyme required for sulfatase activity